MVVLEVAKDDGSLVPSDDRPSNNRPYL